ncbi:MAG: histone deacetylase [Chloroflexi bacterium]|nr:histone deacetylase [Chloroflexota bacterium]
MTTAYVTHGRYPEHDLMHHPEHAGRIRAVWQRLEEAGVLPQLQRSTPDEIPLETLALVHAQTYLDKLAQIRDMQLKQVALLDADTYFAPNSYTIARLSAGGVVRAVDEVLAGRADNALAAVRPPGHHAMPEYAMGFCLFGNIALAARYAQQHYALKRVLIVDYDVHHGNGTQAMFYDDPSVLFVSTHQYPFYPGTGALNETGRGAGTGYTLNVPLQGGHGDKSFAQIFERVLWPAAQRFQPELLLVSAGFDAHFADPLAQMRLSLSGYAHITRELIAMARQLCGGKIVFVMEGGYNLEVLSNGVLNIVYALLGAPTVSDPLGPNYKTEPDVTPLVDKVREIHGLS